MIRILSLILILLAAPLAAEMRVQVTPDMAEGLGLTRPERIVIAQVHPASGFAGQLEPGDMIAAPEVPPRNRVETARRAALPEMMLSTVNPAVIVEEPGPYGARAGLRAGDILREINGSAVSDNTAAARALLIEPKCDGRRMALRLRL